MNEEEFRKVIVAQNLSVGLVEDGKLETGIKIPAAS